MLAEISLADRLSDEDFAKLVSASHTVKEVAIALGYSSGRSARWRITARIERLGLSTKHFRNWVQYGAIPTEDLLVKNSPVNNQTIKKRVLDDGLLKNECVLCGNPGFHNGQPLTLHLDHLDGDNANNELSNLRMLCPNCHAQTSTFGGKNKRMAGKRKLKAELNNAGVAQLARALAFQARGE